MFREKCLVCDSQEIKEIINLGLHPFADSFIPESKKSDSDSVYPLICDLCNSCGHVQTRCITNPEERYCGLDYSYTSSNSSFTRNHWDEFSEDVSKDLQLKPNSFIVEIGSNDGYLSEQFSKKGHDVLGVDPSQHMAKLASERGVKTIQGLFGKEISEKIKLNDKKADLIIANNVFNHINNLQEFTQAVSETLNPEGSFVFEQPYWFELLKSKDFTQIYHEHVNYYSIKSLSTLLEKSGMRIKSVKIVNFHGKSIRVTAQKKEHIKQSPQEIQNKIEEEEVSGLFKPETYKTFMQEISRKRSKFMQEIHKIKENNGKIIAIAAAAKGNTLLNYYKLDNTILDFVTDASPHKIGKYTPATRIPIVKDEIFSKYSGKVHALILTGNLPEKIKDILLNYNKNIEFLTL